MSFDNFKYLMEARSEREKRGESTGYPSGGKKPVDALYKKSLDALYRKDPWGFVENRINDANDELDKAEAAVRKAEDAVAGLVIRLGAEFEGLIRRAPEAKRAELRKMYDDLVREALSRDDPRPPEEDRWDQI